MHEVICLVAAVLIAVGLRFLFTRTRLGVSMRGVVDDPDLLRLNGHNPERIAAFSWALGSTLAVVAGILITPISGGTLEANLLTLLVIDAFRRRHVRPTAQHPAHVRRRDRSRPGRHLRARLLPLGVDVDVQLRVSLR